MAMLLHNSLELLLNGNGKVLLSMCTSFKVTSFPPLTAVKHNTSATGTQTPSCALPHQDNSSAEHPTPNTETRPEQKQQKQHNT
jgi:hypothetical protein